MSFRIGLSRATKTFSAEPNMVDKVLTIKLNAHDILDIEGPHHI